MYVDGADISDAAAAASTKLRLHTGGKKSNNSWSEKAVPHLDPPEAREPRACERGPDKQLNLACMRADREGDGKRRERSPHVPLIAAPDSIPTQVPGRRKDVKLLSPALDSHAGVSANSPGSLRSAGGGPVCDVMGWKRQAFAWRNNSQWMAALAAANRGQSRFHPGPLGTAEGESCKN